MPYRRYSGKSSNRGREIARQHIEDAKRLTYELGGTDEDVKRWFFSLESSKLNLILKKYGQKYGAEKEEYARSTYSRWKSGRTHMSGTVAERFFNLLPPIMPVKDKFRLVESLWNHVGPSKKILIKVGTGSQIEEILNKVSEEVSKLTTEWIVPDEIARRFHWLAQDDSTIYQQLMSHLKLREKELGKEVLKDQIPQLKAKFTNEIADTTSRISYIIEVGKQLVELRMEGSGDRVEVVEWYPSGGKRKGLAEASSNWWIWLIIGIVIIYFLVAS